MIMRIIALTILCISLTVSTAQEMGTPTIYNFRKVDEHHATGGQPTEEQLKAAAAEGFATIINLATIDPRYSLKDEGASVTALGMQYHHIPVPWDQPSEADFALGWSRSQAEEFRASIWHGSDFPVWEDFIRRTEVHVDK